MPASPVVRPTVPASTYANGTPTSTCGARQDSDGELRLDSPVIDAALGARSRSGAAWISKARRAIGWTSSIWAGRPASVVP